VVSRERAEGQYSAAEYLLSKAAVELPLDAFVAVVSIPISTPLYASLTLPHSHTDFRSGVARPDGSSLRQGGLPGTAGVGGRLQLCPGKVLHTIHIQPTAIHILYI
jgi:hypothetical protein